MPCQKMLKLSELIESLSIHSIFGIISPNAVEWANYMTLNPLYFKSRRVKSYEKGGLKALDFEMFIRIFRRNWIKKCLYTTFMFHIPATPLTVWVYYQYFICE